MSFETPFVEYLIIGTHTALWLLLMLMAVLGVPLSTLSQMDSGVVLIFLPFIYLIGMLFDSTVYYLLNPFRKAIRKSIMKYEDYKDEFLAHLSPNLFNSYEARVRRIRILGAAIFNWPLLGAALLLHIDFTNPSQYASIIVTSLLLCILSWTAWRSLYIRAYVFRKDAIDIVRSHQNQIGT